jgi:hypothetical protein
MDGGIVKKTMATPMSDSDIKEYLPHCVLIKYSELSKYPTLDDLLPDIKDCAVILYEESPNKGHWVVVSKPREGVAEYFDSYGGYVDAPLKWTDKDTRVGLGQGVPYLTKLFRECPEEVVYNKVKYQKDGQHIADCGRWCVLRTLKMKAGYDLNQFHKWVVKQDKKIKGDKDHFVSTIIP